MKRRFLGIFLCLLSILLMSHNTFAADVSFDDVHVYFQPTQVLTYCSNGWSTGYCNNVNASNQSLGLTTINFMGSNIQGLQAGQYYFETYIGLSSGASTEAPYVVATPKLANSNTVSFESVSSTTRGSTTVRLYRLLSFWTGGTDISAGLQILPPNGTGAWTNTGAYQVASFTIYRVNNSDATNTQIVNAINSQSQSLNNINNAINTLNNSTNSNGVKLDEINNSIQEQNDKENAAIDNIDNQSTSDIQGTDDSNTTSLIGLFSSFVSALSSASATNCNINGDMGNIDLGTLNFCRDAPPAIVQIIGSIFLIVLFVPLAYFLVKRIIAEVRSFTNG